MTDRVQVLKQEQAALGGDGTEDVEWPEPIDPQEDIIEARGIYFQDESNRDETTVISRDDDDMTFKDGNNPSGATLTQLLLGALPPATQVGQVVYSVDGSTFTVQLPLTSRHGWLVANDGIHIVVG